MGEISGSGGGVGPLMAPLNYSREQQERWRQIDNSMNAISFGFIATAILISMFLVMAIFERLICPQPSLFTAFNYRRGDGGRRRRGETGDLESHQEGAAGKLECPSPKMSIYSKGVSVLMPGHNVPTFIAHPAPPLCPPERITWPSHQQPLSDYCLSSM